MLDVGGSIQSRVELPLAGSTGPAAIDQVTSLIESLLALLTVPLLGIGVGSPGIVDLARVVVSAPNLEWVGVPLQAALFERFGAPVVVANDANAAVLAEQSFGGVEVDLMLVRVGRGVGATPRLEAKLADAAQDATPAAARDNILREADTRLGIVLARIVGALNLSEVVLSGPKRLLAGSLVEATPGTLRSHTMEQFHGGLALRLSTLGDDIVLRDAAIMVTSSRLGVS